MQQKSKKDKISSHAQAKEQNSQDAWAIFFKTFQRVHQAIASEIKKANLSDLEIYDVLWTLEQAPNHALRFRDLAHKVYLARFNITRLCQKLEKQNLIKRTTCPVDKRGVYAKLTTKGLQQRKKIWLVYRTLIDKYFSSKLNPKEHELLIELMKNIKMN